MALARDETDWFHVACDQRVDAGRRAVRDVGRVFKKTPLVESQLRGEFPDRRQHSDRVVRGSRRRLRARDLPCVIGCYCIGERSTHVNSDHILHLHSSAKRCCRFQSVGRTLRASKSAKIEFELPWSERELRSRVTARSGRSLDQRLWHDAGRRRIAPDRPKL